MLGLEKLSKDLVEVMVQVNELTVVEVVMVKILDQVVE
jgi:hypothetical protein